MDLKHLLPPRPRDAHKGDFGHVLVVGGNTGFAGAARMAAEAAARVGAGLVSVATRPQHLDIIAAGRPELMAHGIETSEDLRPLLERATVLVVGPGLGQDDWAQFCFQATVQQKKPTVIDADALRRVANSGAHFPNAVLTPHPGEAAILLHTSIDVIQADRLAAARRIHDDYSAVCVLKGAGTIVYGNDQDADICDQGNPGMATGGMGDVLSGVIAGLLAQGLTLDDAAKLGVWLHATAGDRAAAQAGERGLLATDLMPFLHELVNPKEG